MTDTPKTPDLGEVPAAMSAIIRDVPTTRHTEFGPRPSNLMNVAGYEHLARILGLAFDRSSKGKGKERHANGLPFHEQPILHIARGFPFIAGLGGHAYQIEKKTQEAVKMAATGNLDGAINELLDVAVYASAAVKLIEEQRK